MAVCQTPDVIVANLHRMGRLPILPVSAAVAAVALASTPGLAAAKLSERRDHGAAVSFPLLALPAKSSAATPAAHYSHSSHESHSSHYSHYSGTHNSHASHSSHSSHTSHFSGSPVSTAPTPTPTPSQTTATPQPSSPAASSRGHGHGHGHRHGHGPLKASLRHHRSASPSSVPTSPVGTISPRLTGNHQNNTDSGGADTAVGVVVLAAGITVYIIYRRRKQPR